MFPNCLLSSCTLANSCTEWYKELFSAPASASSPVVVDDGLDEATQDLPDPPEDDEDNDDDASDEPSSDEALPPLPMKKDGTVSTMWPLVSRFSTAYGVPRFTSQTCARRWWKWECTSHAMGVQAGMHAVRMPLNATISVSSTAARCNPSPLSLRAEHVDKQLLSSCRLVI